MQAPLYLNAKTPDKKPTEAHAGLWFERFFNKYDKDKDWQIPKPQPDLKIDPKKDWIETVTGKIGSKAKLDEFHKRQRSLVQYINGQSHCYKTGWHFVSGMGNPHPVENGFSWHPTLAVPYLAGSAVKGLVRAWIEINEDGLTEEEKKARLKHWFGTEDKEQVAEHTGSFIFFDALPDEPPMLLCDIMTPHMGKWYEQGDKDCLAPDAIPADWHEPVPVPFLAVKKASFVFSIAARNPKNKPDDVKEVANIFKALNNALLWLGAGAKTAAGYGYMEKDEEATKAINQQQMQLAKESENKALTEAQRLLLALQQDYEKAKTNPKTQPISGTLSPKLTAAINQAADWSSEDKEALWKLGTEINKTLWNTNKNVRDRLKALQG